MTGLHNNMIGISSSPSVIQNGGRAKPEIAIFQTILNINQYIFASMLARYKISAVTLTFLGSGMSMALVRLLQNETGSGKPKMATYEMDLVICQN